MSIGQTAKAEGLNQIEHGPNHVANTVDDTESQILNNIVLRNTLNLAVPSEGIPRGQVI